MKYEIENPVKIEGKLLATVISNGSKERVKVSKNTLKSIKKKQPDLHKLLTPYFEEKNDSSVKPKSKKTKKEKKVIEPMVTISMLQDAIKNIKNASITLEKDGKNWKVRANRNLFYLHDSKKFNHIIGWDEKNKKHIHIENEQQLNEIIEIVKDSAKVK